MERYTIAISRENRTFAFYHCDLGEAIEQALLYTIPQNSIVNLIDNRTGELIFSYNDITNCTISIIFAEYIAKKLGDA